MSLRLPLIIVRLFAVFFFMKAATYVPITVVDVIGNPSNTSFRLQVLVVSLNLLISFLIFCFPKVILVGLGRQHAEPETERQNGALFQSVVIAAVGLYFGMTGLQDLVYYHLLVSNMAAYGLGQQPLSPQDAAGYWAAAFELVCGLALIAFSMGISNLFNRLRKLSPAPEVDEVNK